MKKIVTIGGVTEDIFIQYHNTESLNLHTQIDEKTFLIFQEGAKVEVEQLSYSSGGGATNSAASFKQLGFDVSSFFRIGNDPAGLRVLKEIGKIGINTKHVLKDPSESTGTSFILPTKSGNRVILAHRGCNKNIKEEELPLELIKQADQLYITSLSHPASQLLPVITTFAKAHGIPVATNPGKSQLEEGAELLQQSLKNIDILILNRSEAAICMGALIQTNPELQKKVLTTPQQLSKENVPHLLQTPLSFKSICFDAQDYFREVLKRGPQVAVVTNGAEGVYVATGNTLYFHPSLPADIVSTVGAGDAFGSCFVGCLTHEKSITESLVAGIINASSVISKLDAKEGQLT
jgi:sugar/nucleoside kinase (ribokinase family)